MFLNQVSKLQIMRGFEDNYKIAFLFFNENICCDPSIGPSRRDGSNEVTDVMVKYEKLSLNYSCFPLLS